MSPRLVQEIQGYKFKLASAGGVCIFASCYDPKAGDFVVSFGQGASHGELAHGEGAVSESSNRPEQFTNLLSDSTGQVRYEAAPHRTSRRDSHHRSRLRSEHHLLHRSTAPLFPSSSRRYIELNDFRYRKRPRCRRNFRNAGGGFIRLRIRFRSSRRCCRRDAEGDLTEAGDGNQ